MDWLKITELVFSVVMPFALLFMGRKMWQLQATLDKIAGDASKAKDTAWETSQKVDNVNGEVNRLREEHKEIQGNQNRHDEALTKFADVVGTKVEIIMRDHASHEVGQARLETKIDWLLDKKDK